MRHVPFLFLVGSSLFLISCADSGSTSGDTPAGDGHLVNDGNPTTRSPDDSADSIRNSGNQGHAHAAANGRTQKNPDYELGAREFVGQMEINGNWPPGHQRPKIVDYSKRNRR